jgi:hypothetical protein
VPPLARAANRHAALARSARSETMTRSGRSVRQTEAYTANRPVADTKKAAGAGTSRGVAGPRATAAASSLHLPAAVGQRKLLIAAKFRRSAAMVDTQKVRYRTSPHLASRRCAGLRSARRCRRGAGAARAAGGPPRRHRGQAARAAPRRPSRSVPTLRPSPPGQVPAAPGSGFGARWPAEHGGQLLALRRQPDPCSQGALLGWCRSQVGHRLVMADRRHELEAALASPHGVHRNACSAQGFDVPEDGALRDLQLQCQILGRHPAAALQQPQHGEQPPGTHPGRISKT